MSRKDFVVMAGRRNLLMLVFSKRLSLVLILVSLAHFDWCDAQVQDSIQDCEKAVADQIAQNSFNTTRTLNQYFDNLIGFKEHVLDLRSDGHWIDSGAGEGVAIQDFYSRQWAQEVPKTTLITYKMKRGVERFDDRTSVFANRYFEEIPESELAPADIITDYYGVLSYSWQKDFVLRRYLELLKPGGVIYLLILDRRTQINTMLGPHPVMLNLEEWLNTIPGIRVEQFYGQGSASVYQITIVNRAQIKVPQLKLIGTDTDSPPHQEYNQEGFNGP